MSHLSAVAGSRTGDSVAGTTKDSAACLWSDLCIL